ncbi:hypothetical protein M9H77_12879 [Catharanthus roseus]|uniref:Uncharacterized protein n=1 Tax=Catharanthus roseus TaxID=4058 RepID=A0ACC0BIK0_CATRO|nr:hypothetical protein M9H77_12879 [Catharanthus roseus]
MTLMAPQKRRDGEEQQSRKAKTEPTGDGRPPHYFPRLWRWVVCKEHTKSYYSFGPCQEHIAIAVEKIQKSNGSGSGLGREYSSRSRGGIAHVAYYGKSCAIAHSYTLDYFRALTEEDRVSGTIVIGPLVLEERTTMVTYDCEPHIISILIGKQKDSICPSQRQDVAELVMGSQPCQATTSSMLQQRAADCCGNGGWLHGLRRTVASDRGLRKPIDSYPYEIRDELRRWVKQTSEEDMSIKSHPIILERNASGFGTDHIKHLMYGLSTTCLGLNVGANMGKYRYIHA